MSPAISLSTSSAEAHFITALAWANPRHGAAGGLRFWKDGRDVPDVMLGLFDYPEGFNLSLRVNFVIGGEENEGLLFTGSEGTIEIAGNSVILSRVPLEKEPGLTIGHLYRCHAIEDSRGIRQKNILINYPPDGCAPGGL